MNIPFIREVDLSHLKAAGIAPWSDVEFVPIQKEQAANSCSSTRD